MIGTWLQPRRPWITSTPSMPGRPRSSDDEVGMLARGELEGRLAGWGEVDLVAAGAEVRARARAGSAARRRRRGCGSSARLQAHDHRQPAAGGVLDLDLAAHRLDEALRDREAEPDAVAAAGVAESLEGQEHPLALGRRDARAAVDDPHVDVAVDRPGRDPRRRRARASARPRSRSRWRARARAGRRRRGPAGSDSGRSSATSAAREPRLRGRPAAPRRDRRAPRGSRARRSGAGSCRAGCRRVRSGGRSPRRSWRGTRARSSGRQSTSSWSRLVTDALIPASGVRRSCDTAERIAVRSSLAATRVPAADASACELVELDRRRRAPAAKASSTRRSSSPLDRRPGRASTCVASMSTVSAACSGVGRRRRRSRRRRASRSPSRWSTAAPSKPKARRMLAMISSTDDEPASVASVPASARARAPSAARRAASATKPLTTPATARNTVSASRFSPSPIVNV